LEFAKANDYFTALFINGLINESMVHTLLESNNNNCTLSIVPTSSSLTAKKGRNEIKIKEE